MSSIPLFTLEVVCKGKAEAICEQPALREAESENYLCEK